MAIQWSIIQRRSDSASIAGTEARDGLDISWDVEYTLEVSDDADPGFTGETVTAVEAAAAPVLPRAGKSVYYENGVVIPFLVCTNKSARRKAENRRLFDVQVSYSGNGDQSGPPPINVSDIAPQVEYIVDERQELVYSDLNDKKCLTPTNNFFDDPFLRRFGGKTRRITQYELSLSHDQMATRMLAANSAAYAGEPVYSWLITAVEARDIQVTLQSGLTDAVLVSYTLRHNPSEHGWLDNRALIDSHYLRVADDLDTKRPYIDKENLRGASSCMLNPNGTIAADQDTPQYDQWELLGKLDYLTFLQA